MKDDRSYQVYSAGGLFTLHELAGNVLIKQAVWELSQGRFELVLPQSKEIRDADRPDLAAYIRNTDLMQVVQCDIMLARFDGVELDTGTVMEFAVAKMLGKPALILRGDSRRLGTDKMDEPYNLMVKNWPRTLEVHLDSLITYAGDIAQERGIEKPGSSYERTIRDEHDTIARVVTSLAEVIVQGLEKVLALPSPYTAEQQDQAYQLVRYTVGSGFEDVLSVGVLEKIVSRLRQNGTL